MHRFQENTFLASVISLHHAAQPAKGGCGVLIQFFFVRAAGQIAPERDVLADLPAHADERLHDDVAGVADVMQRLSDGVPVKAGIRAGAAAVRLADVKMAEQLAAAADGVGERVLFNVHMERVQHDLDVGPVDRADIVDALLRGG